MIETNDVRIAMLIGVLATVAACAEGPTQPSETIVEAPPSASFDLGNAPPASGPFVVRVPSGYGLFFTDNERELIAFHTLDDSLLGCREATVQAELLTVQAIFGPTGVAQFLARTDVSFVAVVDLTGLAIIPPFCDLVTGPRRIAEGFSRLALTNTDLLDAGTRRRTISFKGNGRLENLLGSGQLSYSMEVRLLEGADGTLEALFSNVVLGPDPR